METGTGKTYVYIKSMFELNKRYGWGKFIVVVPSIAILEGVAKSFDMLESHFFEYYGKKAKWFKYKSSNLNLIDDFSRNSDIQLMFIKNQAFNRINKKSVNKLTEQEKLLKTGKKKSIDTILD